MQFETRIKEQSDSSRGLLANYIAKKRVKVAAFEISRVSACMICIVCFKLKNLFLLETKRHFDALSTCETFVIFKTQLEDL